MYSAVLSKRRRGLNSEVAIAVNGQGLTCSSEPHKAAQRLESNAATFGWRTAAAPASACGRRDECPKPDQWCQREGARQRSRPPPSSPTTLSECPPPLIALGRGIFFGVVDSRRGYRTRSFLQRIIIYFCIFQRTTSPNLLESTFTRSLFKTPFERLLK